MEAKEARESRRCRGFFERREDPVDGGETGEYVNRFFWINGAGC